MFGFGQEEKPLAGFGASSKLTDNHLFGFQKNLQSINSASRAFEVAMKDPYPNHTRLLEQNRQILEKQSAYHSSIRNTLFNNPTNPFTKTTVAFGNRVNSYLAKKGRGYIEGGFKTVGEMVAAAPLKSLATGYGVGLGMMGVVEFGVMGKPISIGNIAQLATDNIAFTLGSELAGTGMKGMAKYMGWQMLGSELGLGTWGSLGLQVAGSLAVPGLGWGLGAGMLAFKGGKALYKGMKSIHDLGAASKHPEFTTRDMSWSSQNALTMRERSLGAIQNSHLNLRAVLGNEARMLMMAR